jgi:signal transduction histidine kinase
MSRPLSLRVWLALGLALVVVAPAVAGLVAWFAAGEWQDSRESARTRDATATLRAANLDTRAGRDQVIARLAQLDVEAQVVVGAGSVGPQVKQSIDAIKADAAKRAGIAPNPLLVTPKLAAIQTAGGKQGLAAYRPSLVMLDGAVAELWVRPESAAARWAVALAAGALALAAALAVVVVLLRRWVIRPLARLAQDADRIAGGELDVAPVPTRAREVAQVGEALHGMAGSLGQALQASAAAERERRFLVTAIAHDLRTPLFTLRGSLEALERGIGDGRYLGLAQDRAAHLDGLVSDLFRFSRLDYARETAPFDELDAAALAQRAAAAVEPLAAEQGRAITVAASRGALPVRGDEEALLRVLTNLLDNAIRHGRARVTVSTWRENGTVGIDVADDGPGFAERDLEHVFEPLFRADPARSGAGAHSGLGLAIARRLARAHGGDVRAANDPAGGARLTVELPAAS